MKFERISRHPNICDGQPNIRGMDVSVRAVLNLLADGKSFAEIIGSFPGLEKGDIEQALRYSAWLVAGEAPLKTSEPVTEEMASLGSADAWDTLKAMIGKYENLPPLNGRSIPPIVEDIKLNE
jgi:uncharacterized protein (DUF433 family)